METRIPRTREALTSFARGPNRSGKAARCASSVRDVVKRRGLLTDEQLDTVLNVREMTEPGIPGGGVAGGGGG